MSNKRDLHTLFIKHDTDFGTLSKKALSEVIIKIILFQNGGTKLSQIKAEIASVITGNVSEENINDSLKLLEKEKKIIQKRGRFNINPDIKQNFEDSVIKNKELQDRIYKKYLSGGTTPINILQSWFQDSLINFFENFSMEWFNHVAQNGKVSSKKIEINVSASIDEVMIKYDGEIVNEDKVWLKKNFIKFYQSDDIDENLMFWNFGMSMFSSRLITARNYADKISIETYKNGTFLLDTNILMILDLDGHELGKSFESLDKILNKLNIKTKYLHITSEEYKRAITGRKNDTIHVFEEFDIEVLEKTKCPFVKTALKRGCCSTDDVERLFNDLYDIPTTISKHTRIEIIDNIELDDEVQKGCKDEDLKEKINNIHLRRLKRDKKENPKIHDAGMVYGVNYLRKTDPTWILTTDGTLKYYAIENISRDESEIAIGLDALIGMFAVNGGGVNVDSSDFAPLFKNLIKCSLVPDDHIFDVRDLAFILSTNLRVNDLHSEKVIEISNEVRRMRIAGKDDSDISLFLRREIEGQKLSIVSDLGKAKISEGFARDAKEIAEKERDVAYNEIRERRRGELRDKYDSKLRNNRFKMILIPILVGIIVFLTVKFGLNDKKESIQYLIGCSVELIFGLLPLIPINKRLVRKYSEYIVEINRIVENEIIEIKKKAKDSI